MTDIKLLLLKQDLALNYLERLIYHETQSAKVTTFFCYQLIY